MRAAGRLPEAIGEIERAPTGVGDDASLLRLKKELESQREGQLRSEAAQSAAQEAEDYLSRNDAVSATRILQSAVSKNLASERLTKLIGVAEARLLEQQRDQAIGRIADEVSRLAGDAQFGPALLSVNAGLKQFPDAGPLVRLRETVLAAEARAALLEEVRRLSARGDFELALFTIESALQKMTADRELLDLKARMESEGQRQKRSQEVRRALEQAQTLLREGHPEDALKVLQQAAKQYPNESQFASLLNSVQEQLDRERRRAEIETVGSRAEAFLGEGKPEEAVALIESKSAAGEPLLKDVFGRAQKGAGVRRRDALFQRAADARRLGRYDEASQILNQVIGRYEATPAIIEFQTGLQRDINQKRAREARERCLEQLLALERRVAGTPKRKLNQIRSQAGGLAEAYRADAEIASIAARINHQIDAALTPAVVEKLIPWKLIGGAAAAAVLAIAIASLLFRGAPPATMVPVEVLTDPPGASIRLADQSCVTPDCRLSLRPDEYEVQAQLDGYRPARETLTVEAGRSMSPLNLVLQPVPPPPPPPAAAPAADEVRNGTLVVETGVPDVLVFVDNVLRGRTGTRGSLRLPLPPNTYSVRVMREGFNVFPESRQVGLKPDLVGGAFFTVNPKKRSKRPPRTIHR